MYDETKIFFKAFLLIICPLSFEVIAERFDANFFYAAHSDFWNDVKSLENSKDPIQQIERFFDREVYGSKEGIVQTSFDFTSTELSYFGGFFNQSSMGFGVNGLAGGEAYNRISPELRGYAFWDADIHGRFERKVVSNQSGWEAALGTTLGLGRQKLTEGDAFDFISETPTQDSTIFYNGFDLELGYVSQFSERSHTKYRGFLLPTFYYSEFDNADYSYGVKKNKSNIRWRTEFEKSFAFQDLSQGGWELGTHVIGGQQPTPVRILPRVWDSLHGLKFMPSLASLIGAGLSTRFFNSSRSFKLGLSGGFYGGYFGYGANISFHYFNLEAGSYGFEQTANFRTRESRVNYAHLGVFYDW